MNLTIEPSALEYIKKSKEKSIYIYTNGVRGCCGGQTTVELEPQINLGKPHANDIEEYDLFNKFGINIYIRLSLVDKLAKKRVVLNKYIGIIKRISLEDL